MKDRHMWCCLVKKRPNITKTLFPEWQCKFHSYFILSCTKVFKHSLGKAMWPKLIVEKLWVMFMSMNSNSSIQLRFLGAMKHTHLLIKHKLASEKLIQYHLVEKCICNLILTNNLVVGKVLSDAHVKCCAFLDFNQNYKIEK